ncbi:MAG: 50S ribosomal protein L6 [Mollicutes bacterium]|jgi:large subunit ribosomal protein L6|nr:50S ribosomal protein L6 [Mollicutes bacterium]
MSRIGNRVISIPENVTVTVNDNIVSVKGPKGELSTKIDRHLSVEINDNKIIITRQDDNFKNLHGTANANIKNMIVGVTQGYEKGLEIIGVGYRFALEGRKLVVNAGYSHPIKMDIPAGITVEIPSNTELKIKGIDKCLVGEFAAQIRKIREPEPYKGKGIRYKDEYVRRKEGKKASK